MKKGNFDASRGINLHIKLLNGSKHRDYGKLSYLGKVQDKALGVLKKVGGELKDVLLYTTEFVKENAPTTKDGFRHFLRTHPKDLVFSVAGALTSLYTSGSVAYVLSDPLIRIKLIYEHKIPERTRFIPPNKGLPTPPPSGLVVYSSRHLNAIDIFSLISPILAVGLTVGIEYVRYRRWKNES